MTGLDEKKPFNWLAAFFGFFWFPFKGLWREFRFYYVYFGFLHILVGFFARRYPEYENISLLFILIIDAILFVHIGKNASKRLHEYTLAKSLDLDHGRKRVGLVTTIIYFVVMAGAFAFIKDYVTLIRLQKESISRTLSFTYKVIDNRMYPSFAVDDVLNIDTTVPEIYAGDIIAYRVDNGALEVARVIAIAGDKVVRKDGKLTINDEEVERETYSKAEFVDSLPDEYRSENYLIQNELNEEISYFILVDGTKFDDRAFVVPKNKIFIMLDNRSEELDEGRILDISLVKGVHIQ